MCPHFTSQIFLNPIKTEELQRLNDISINLTQIISQILVYKKSNHWLVYQALINNKSLLNQINLVFPRSCGKRYRQVQEATELQGS